MRQLPFSLDAEKAVLGSMFIDPYVIIDVLKKLSTSSFYDSTNRSVFSAILKLNERNESIDYISVLSVLEVIDKSVSKDYLITLGDFVPSSANVSYYVNIVQRKSDLRKIINFGSSLTEKSYDENTDLKNLLEQTDAFLFEMSKIKKSTQIQSLTELYQTELQNLEDGNGSGGLIGITTGYDKLDELTAGFCKGDLIVIAGRPSMGKSSFAMNIGMNMAKSFSNEKKLNPKMKKKSVAVITLEMSALQTCQRVMASLHKIDSNHIRRRELTTDDWDRIHSTSNQVYDVTDNFHIVDSSALNTTELRSIGRDLVRSYGCEIIIIDYLQLLTSNAESRFQEVSKISRQLKSLAKELDIPVVALSQLSRKNEDRTDKKPILSDLRESGQLEQDLDVGIFLHRPEYYGIENLDNKSSSKDVTQVIIAKQRLGALGEVLMSFEKEYNTFKPFKGNSKVRLY